MLRARAGIQVSDTSGGGPSFSLRGFTGGQAANNTLILVDGVRRLNKQGGVSFNQVSSILISQIERVEILSGSAGVLYGDQAVGGVINIITKGLQKMVVICQLALVALILCWNVDVSRKLNEQWSLFFSASQDDSDKV